MKALLSFLCWNLLISTVYSQGNIRGKVQNIQEKGVSYANVLLRNVSDSVLVKGAITDEFGDYNLSEISEGEYFIEAFILGYAKSYSPKFNFSGAEKIVLATITLIEEAKNLDEVTVNATKPLFEMEMGKMVVNLASSVTAAGLSVIDVLERSPGVLVNRQSNTLSLSGKDGVVILMNGKRFRMPIDAAYQMLAGLNSSDVEKIEIMTVPPANYDADGNAGFINVVMKRDNGLVGTNGTVTLGQGYGSGYNGNFSFNINHQGPKFSWFGLLSSTYADQVGEYEQFRGNTNGIEDIRINTETERISTRKSINYQAGFDYSIGKNTILSALVSGYENRWDMTAPNTTESVYSISPDTLVTMTTIEENYWSHIMGNINLHHTFQNGQVLNANLDYLTYKNSNPTWYTTNYFTESNDLFRSEDIRISKDTPIDIWVADLTHSMKIGESLTIDSGVKGTFSQFTNQVIFEEQIDSEWVFNSSYSSDAILKEDILAAFTSAKITFDEKTTLNAGLRYENTKTNLTSVSGEEIVFRHYGDFFPTVFLSRKINPDNNFQISYGRRITRPTFNQMAPWVIFSDPFTLFAGNENILPTYTNNIKTDYSHKGWIFSVQYSLDKNIIVPFQPTLDEETNTVFLKTDNLDESQTVSMIVAFPW